MKTNLGSSAMVVVAMASAGCSGLLGLDDKLFDDSTGGGGTGGQVTSSTGGAGGTTTDTAGGGGSTTTNAAGGGGTGGGALDPLDDELDFEATGDQTPSALADRGWLFTWREPTKEGYPEFGPPDDFPYPDMDVTGGQLQFSLKSTFYWVNQRKGLLMYKQISGDFLVVADVLVSDHAQPTPGIPQDEQAGAGLMVRDPASSAFASGGQSWLAIDRSGRFGVSYVHASWGRGAMDSSVGEPALPGGKIAICRTGDDFQVWSRDGGSAWVPRSALLDTLPEDFNLPDEVQVGFFVYAYNFDVGTGVDLMTPDGVKGTFQYIRQYDASRGCNPTLHGE